MESPQLFLSLLILLLIVVAYSSIAIANEDERFAVFLLGRFEGLKGPGLVLKTHVRKLHRLRIGDVGTLTSPEFARFGEANVPVGDASNLRVGDAVQITGFDNQSLRLARSSLPPKHKCPNCGHEYY